MWVQNKDFFIRHSAAEMSKIVNEYRSRKKKIKNTNLDLFLVLDLEQVRGSMMVLLVAALLFRGGFLQKTHR